MDNGRQQAAMKKLHKAALWVGGKCGFPEREVGENGQYLTVQEPMSDIQQPVMFTIFTDGAGTSANFDIDEVEREDERQLQDTVAKRMLGGLLATKGLVDERVERLKEIVDDSNQDI